MATSASPEVQKQKFGERFYPLVKQMYPDLAPKITGMLLELDNSELQQMMLSKDIFQARVLEAVAVLQTSASANKQENTSGGADTELQRQIFGERLFPLIQNMYPNMAGKITGMLLELEVSELQHILESKEALETRVQEAVAVLQSI